jgi:hypothetical protein
VISWHRFYDPETGRYISADPIGLAGGMNLYAYVGGNPVNWVDPEGLYYQALAQSLIGISNQTLAGAATGLTLAGSIGSAILGPDPEIAELERRDRLYPIQMALPGDESINPDGTVDDSAGVDNSCDKKGKWKCWGKAQYDQENTPKHVRRGSTMIIAYGHDRPSARNAWIKKSQNAAPRHFTARHIMPQCKKIR